LLGRRASALRVAGSSPMKFSAASAGDRRSGSGKTTSKPITAGRAEAGQPVDEIRKDRPCPWPLADLGETLVVDVDDRDGPIRDGAGK
jgi:hypothetical protein